MDTLECIASRRSIRKFQSKPVPTQMIEQIIGAATLAPSGKNRQPWHFVIVQGERRADMVRILREGIEQVKKEGGKTGSSPWTANIMEQAPVTIFVFNPHAKRVESRPTLESMVWNTVDTQSAGAAIQNMLLAAQELGLGSLWICDVFYAYEALCEWLGQDTQMIAAVSIGYADESPGPRLRRSVGEVTEWL
jgi:nitroreductase